MKAARLLIVDAFPLMRLGLKSMISTEPDIEVCGEAANSAGALVLVDDLRPDLLILDLFLRDGSGLELIKQISNRAYSPLMLVISTHDELLFAERTLRAGAMGFIDKGESPAMMIDAIRHVLRGKVYLSQRMTEHMLRRVAENRWDLSSPDLALLSDRELEVFELLGHGLGTRAVAARLGLSFKTVESYRESIKRKLGLRAGTELVRRAVQWVLETH